MASVSLSVKILKDRRKQIQKAVNAQGRSAMRDVVDSLAKTSSGSAPHDKGILEDSWTADVNGTGANVTGTVSYSVREGSSGGRYNYAVKMHEGNYKLGAGSRAKPGGTGMSGRKYPVGKKFLTGVADGEAKAYAKHIEKTIKLGLI